MEWSVTDHSQIAGAQQFVLMKHTVWHGTQEKYQIFDTLGGRFNSEFGMEAFPHIDTIRYYCTDPTQLYPQSHMLDFHNKADGYVSSCRPVTVLTNPEST